MSQHTFFFESYGTIVKFEAGDEELLEIGRQVATKALVGNLEFIDNTDGLTPHTEFGVFRDEDRRLYFTYDDEVSGKNDELVHFARTMNSMVRVLVAANATPWVFVHAGVVGWRGMAIVLPARSHEGKTTLVSELLKAGAEYYSDEYAVIDGEGLIHPFARDLSVREPEEIVPISRVPEEFGAKVGERAIPIGLVVLTKYVSGTDWEPKELSVGNGIIETVPQVIPISFKPEITLKVLNSAFRRAIILSGSRGDAKIAASQILSFFDNSVLLGKIS